MSKKVLIATEKPFAVAASQKIVELSQKAGYQIELLEKYETKDQLIQSLQGIDALIVRSDKITKDVMEKADSLKIIVRGGAGYDNIDLVYSKNNDIVVMNTPGQNSNAVAELTLGLMIYAARNNFNPSSGRELKGKTLGLHAYGNVGKLVAGIARGFGMTIYAYDPFLNKEDIEKDNIIVLDSIEQLYKKSQYISLHIPSNEKTKALINYNLLSLMPPGATLINTARKEVICENSLLKIFSQREDFKYYTDIAPNNKDELSEKYPDRYFGTPKKMGAQTLEANINAATACITQIIDFFEKGICTYQVNQ
jgi:D-3-phosphoglycerate dehydrogenase